MAACRKSALATERSEKSWLGEPDLRPEGRFDAAFQSTWWLVARFIAGFSFGVPLLL
jgi:hypothetical protein